jgi:hypothetical protein
MQARKADKTPPFTLCGSLNSLPRTMPTGLGLLDLSYCSQMEALAVQLVDLAEQMPRVHVTLRGWEALVDDDAQGDSIPLCSKHLMRSLRTKAIVVKLLTDKDAFISSCHG